MIINHNISALFAHRQLKFNSIDMDKDIEKLSSGLRINRAADDAAGLAVSEKMRAQIKGLNRAAKNAEDGISFIQTTEGYLQKTQDILHRIRELAVQAANGVYTAEDRSQIQVEISALVDEIDRIASQAQFNGMTMLTGKFSDPTKGGVANASFWLHVGANMNERERLYIGTMNSDALGIRSIANQEIITVSTQNTANSAIGTVDLALYKVSKERANLGAYQNRLEFAVKGIMVGEENLQASESRIRDTDMAGKMVDFVKNQILTQAATSMLAQANTKPQNILSLLR